MVAEALGQPSAAARRHTDRDRLIEIRAFRGSAPAFSATGAGSDAVVVLDQPAEPDAEGKQARIMVVDDSEDLLTVMKELLEDEGHDVSTFRALPPIEQVARDSPDLIVLDVMFGHSPDGLIYLEQLRERASTRSIPIVLCTAAHEMMAEQYCRPADSRTTMLTKPFNIDQLLDAVSMLRTC